MKCFGAKKPSINANKYNSHYEQIRKTEVGQDNSLEFKNQNKSQYLYLIEIIESQINYLSSEKQVETFAKNILELFAIVQQTGESEYNDKLKELIKKVVIGQEQNVIKNLLHTFLENQEGKKFIQENEDIFKQWYLNKYEVKYGDKSNSLTYLYDRISVNQPNGDADFEINELKKQYQFFDKYYQDTFSIVSVKKLDRDSLIKSILLKVKDFKECDNSYLTNSNITWSTQQKEQIIKILAEISVVWTLIDSQSCNQGGIRFTHNYQIFSIMRLLNIDQSQQSYFYNHLIEVCMGEGHSIIVGICSTILALLGFQVDCCYYCEYLSDRDFSSFEPFFSFFQVQHLIQYNTFEKLTENRINYTFYNYRTQLDNQFSNNSNNSQDFDDRQDQNQPKVLIFDEVDYFLSSRYQGETFTLTYQYTGKEVVNLMKLIWRDKYKYITFDTIIKSKEYNDLFVKNPKLTSMREAIDKNIKEMIKDTTEMDRYNYFLSDKQEVIQIRNGIQQTDGVNYYSTKGYKQAFAYLQEWQRGNILDEQLFQKLAFNLTVGCFSYPLLLESYSHILGVTCVFSKMTDQQQQKMKAFCNFQKFTQMPSLFRDSKLKFNPQQDVYMFTSQQEYFEKIFNQVYTVVNQGRSVIVFFENQRNLFDYKKYSEENKVYNFIFLDEYTQDIQSELTNMAGETPVAIILSLKRFGRGTDFHFHSNSFKNNEGTHVIQTFFSDTITEQNLIQGRVARLDHQASYSLILLQKDLEQQFQIHNFFIDKQYPLYSQLNDINYMRAKFMNTQDYLFDKKQEEILIYHKKSMELKQLLNQPIKVSNKIEKLLNEIELYEDKKVNKVSELSYYYNSINHEDLRNKEKDIFNNYQTFGLGKEGQFKDASILIGQFCFCNDVDITSSIQNELKNCLQEKGFKNFVITTDERQFTQISNQFDQIWIISGYKFVSQDQDIEQDFVNSVLQHLSERKGLFIFSDNDPFYMHANLILNKIPIGYEDKKPVFMQLQGNEVASNILRRGIYNQTLQFGEHPVTLGLNEIYEGDSICYPKVLNNKQLDTYDDFLDLQIIGTSTTNRPCMFILNANNERGRIVFDCGITKILSNYLNTAAGISQYIQNCYSWLYFLDKEEQ